MTGRLWPLPDRDGETGPATRLQRKGILIPDLMVAFEINVAGVIARRPRVPGVGGRSRGNPRPAPGGADMECLHAMRTLAMVLLEDPDYPVDVWSSFYRAVNEVGALRMSRPVLRTAGADAG